MDKGIVEILKKSKIAEAKKFLKIGRFLALSLPTVPKGVTVGNSI